MFCLPKNYSAFYSSLPVIIMVDGIFYQNLHSFAMNIKINAVFYTIGSTDEGCLNAQNALFPTDILDYLNASSEYHFSLPNCHTMSILILKNSLY